MSQLARKTQSGMEEIDPEEELVSIWAKSGTKEVSSLDMYRVSSKTVYTLILLFSRVPDHIQKNF